ncbi:MAG: NTP transferase domain-containing protein [Rhodospirillales bacterium]|jgi:NDP-sugar pyrophosphorylase family protein|nr:NTP transferase domain-containing protein [Rhodospirillales bacterium]
MAIEENNNFNIVVPMAGVGQRFVDAGYTTPKALIPILGKPMVQHTLDAFPEHVSRHLIIAENAFSDEQLDFFKNILNCNLVFVEPHKLGPAYSFHLAAGSLPLEQSIFVSYCDIFWTWDFDEIATNLDQDGVIYTHRKFHPHLVNNNFSAFCRPREDDANQAAEIREKQSFTDQWMEEPLSIGAFYARRGHELADAIKNIVDSDDRTANEFFPSVAFNQLIANGGDVGLQDVDFFIHWGLPEQLDDFLRWKEIHETDLRKRNDRNVGKNIVCMAGSGSRMKGVGDIPKPFLEIRGQPMYAYVADQFPVRDVDLITSPAVTNLLSERGLPAPALPLPRQTPDQLTTLREASSLLSREQKFFLSSCDAYGCFNAENFAKFLEIEDPDAVIFTFSPSLMQAKLAQHHTHVSVSGNRVTAVHIKSKSSPDDLGLGGFFWVRDGKYFGEIDNITDDENELCADHAFKEFIRQERKVLHFLVDQYVHIGTPEEYLEFGFWLNHFDKFPGVR